MDLEINQETHLMTQYLSGNWTKSGKAHLHKKIEIVCTGTWSRNLRPGYRKCPLRNNTSPPQRKFFHNFPPVETKVKEAKKVANLVETGNK